jgi:hypothetical protein
MRTAADDPDRSRAFHRNPDGTLRAVGGTKLGTFAGTADVGLAHHRNMHNAQHRTVILDQRNIDGEFTVPFHELAGTVQRVDQPVTLPRTAHVEVGQSAFLRYNWHIGCQLAQAFHDRTMRRHVCLGQRRVIVLGFDVEVGRVDFENCSACTDRCRNHRFDELFEIHC